MAGRGTRWWVLRLMTTVVVGFIVAISLLDVAEPRLERDVSGYNDNEEVVEFDSLKKVLSFRWRNGQLGYEHVWPEMKFRWKIVVGTIIGFFGAAFGSVGGVGGGGMFVPMLTLIIGFDAKSSTAISKCMITGAAASAVYYNLKRRHPTLDMPIIDYDLALLFQPMLVLGISIGVAFNVIFADWMIIILLIILFLGTSAKAFFKGIETWKKETIMKREAARFLNSDGKDTEEVAYEPLPRDPANGAQTNTKESGKEAISILENIRWKELGLLVSVWVVTLLLQIIKDYTSACSLAYWVTNLLQIPVTVGVTSYEAVSLYRGQRKIVSKGGADINWKLQQLVVYSALGVLAGVVGGLLGLGGGFILGPLFLDLGIPPQVSSATATFAMAFSASMSVVEYYLLSRFPVPYALYFVAVATIAALVGQHVVGKIVHILGRASLIIFILSFTIFISAISLGGVGIVNMIEKIEQNEHVGFENICSYES